MKRGSNNTPDLSTNTPPDKDAALVCTPVRLPIIQQIGAILRDIPGEVTVSGHTDNDQVSDELNSNNWELSSKRAVSVAVELLNGTGMDKNRLVVVGHADTRPLVDNDTEQNRKRNRRVEISILQGKAKESDPIQLKQPPAQPTPVKQP